MTRDILESLSQYRVRLAIMFQNLAVLHNQDLHSPKKLVSPLRALPYHPMITLKRPFLYLFARPNPINVTAMTKHHA